MHPLATLAISLIPKLIDKSKSSKKEEIKDAVKQVVGAVKDEPISSSAALAPLATSAMLADASVIAIPESLEPYSLYVHGILLLVSAVLATYKKK